MFYLDGQTAAVPPSAPGAANAIATAATTNTTTVPSSLSEVQWTIIDGEEIDSMESTSSTNNSNNDGTATSATGPERRSGDAQTSAFPHSPHSPGLNALPDEGLYPHCPIFIPSRGRSDMDRSTMGTLVRDLVPFVLVVEEEEADAYNALLDRVVAQHFGFSGMVYTAPAAMAEEGEPAELAANGGGEGGAAPKSTTGTSPSAIATPPSPPPPVSDLWDFPCACCERDEERKEGEREAAASDAVRTLAERLSAAFHHGYVFEPPTQDTASAEGDEEEKAGKAKEQKKPTEKSTEASTANPAGTADRRPSAAFVLHNVEEVRALFKIEVLPETNRGVSYVRNYILQVLVPRLMVSCGVDRSGNVEELCLCAPGEHQTLTAAALRSAGLEADVYTALRNKIEMERFLDRRRTRAAAAAAAAASGMAGASGYAAASSESLAPKASSLSSPSFSSATTPPAPPRETPRLLHGLFGFYWVLDDDIYGFYTMQSPGARQQRISTRAMLREVETRLRTLRRNADVATPPPPPVPPAGFLANSSTSAGAGSPTMMVTSSSPSGYVAPLQLQQQRQHAIFTCKEDALANNFVSAGKGRYPTMQNYNLYYTTACFSLEYNRFAIGSGTGTLAANSYNNIACLFNYALLHNPPQMRYFPLGVPNVRRPEEALVGYLGHSMLWYRFAIREDYDFTLQLIARGLYTLRFRSLSFDVPQMMKVRGGMTDYYRNCHEEIRKQNDRFVLQWPSVAQHWVKGKDDKKRNDIRVRWDLLSPARAKYPGAFLYLNTPLPQLQPQRVTEETDGGEDAEGGGKVEPIAAVEAAESRKRARPASPLAVPSTPSPQQEQDQQQQQQQGSSTVVLAPPPALPLQRPPTAVTAAAAVTRAAGAAPTSKDWKGGYVVERWRDIDADEARENAGLIPLPNDTIHIGQTVAAIPPFFEQQPSVVLATVIERSVVDEGNGSEVYWTAVAQDVRGMPFLHVKTCYKPPPEGIVEAAERLDRFFTGIKDE